MRDPGQRGARRRLPTVGSGLAGAAVLAAVAVGLWDRGSRLPVASQPTPTPPQAVGALAGFTLVTGTAGAGPTLVANRTDPAGCAPLQRLDDLIVSAGGGLANVIVGLVGVAVQGRPAEPRLLTLDNRECQFEPRASVATVGSRVAVVNSDATLHTAHFAGGRERNIALPLRGMRAVHVLDTPGIATVRCDVHGWMSAFIRVDPHPYHAVSNAAGEFRIAGIPPGEYRLEAWHERFGATSRSVRVRANETSRVMLDYAGPAPRRR